MAASAAAEASNEALKAMLMQEHGTEGLLDAWLTLSAHKAGGFLTAVDTPPHELCVRFLSKQQLRTYTSCRVRFAEERAKA